MSLDQLNKVLAIQQYQTKQIARLITMLEHQNHVPNNTFEHWISQTFEPSVHKDSILSQDLYAAYLATGNYETLIKFIKRLKNHPWFNGNEARVHINKTVKRGFSGIKYKNKVNSTKLVDKDIDSN